MPINNPIEQNAGELCIFSARAKREQSLISMLKIAIQNLLA